MTERRKLAAILAADVVGYSRLTRADEDGTLARLRALRNDLIDPTITAHNGRVVKRTGDGALVEFRSVVDAVRCAVEIQNGMVERNAGVPSERALVLRIGVHIGDVVEEADGDLMGDGVNVAARLEGIAQPGTICLSSAAYEQVRDKLKYAFLDLGERELKNIARPVRVYAVECSSENLVSIFPDPAPTRPTPPRLSIVVLPFANIAGDPNQEHFVDGVTESLTTDLSRIRGSFVIARNTAFTYKGKPVDVKQIGRELNVRYVLEGSVQRGSNRMRVNIQLIEAETAAHLWAERFDKPITDLLDMQDEIVARLANSLAAQLATAEADKSARKLNPDSMDFYFQGRVWQNRGATSENLREARRFYERSLALDPENVDALVGLAQVETTTVANYLNIDDRTIHLQRAASSSSKAVSIAAGHARANIAWGNALAYSGRAAQGIAKFLRALELDANSANAHFSIGLSKIFVGRCDETEGHILQALRLSPKDPAAAIWTCVVGHSKVHLQQYEEAVSWLERGIELNPSYSLARFYYAVALEALGRVEEAKDEVKTGLSLNPRFSIARFRASASGDNPIYLSQRDHIYEGMRRAGTPEQ